MHARPGSRIVVKGHHVGEPGRDCEVLVRWADDGTEGPYFPGDDAVVEPYADDSSTNELQ